MRASKVNKAGKAPIEVMISLGDERVVFSTGKLVALESWNKDKQCVRGVNSEAVALNEFIKSMRVRIYEEEIKLVKHGFSVTATLLRDALMNKVELIKEETILGIYRKHNELQYKQIGMGVSKGTYANSKHGLELLEKFIRVTYNRDDVFLREFRDDRRIRRRTANPLFFHRFYKRSIRITKGRFGEFLFLFKRNAGKDVPFL